MVNIRIGRNKRRCGARAIASGGRNRGGRADSFAKTSTKNFSTLDNTQGEK